MNSMAQVSEQLNLYLPYQDVTSVYIVFKTLNQFTIGTHNNENSIIRLNLKF